MKPIMSVLVLVGGVTLAMGASLAWAQCEVEKLTAADAAAGDRLGCSVSVSQGVVVVGAYWDDFVGKTNAGSAYVFRYGGSNWIPQEQKLTASDAAAGDKFGHAVSIDGEVLVVGAPEKSTSSGAAYVFRYDGSTWVQEKKLTPSDAATWHYFGASVAVSGNVIAVGTPYDDDDGPDSGSAYVFRYNGSTWVQEAKLTSADAAGGDRFGVSLSLSGERVVVGAYNDDHVGGIDAGSAYVFGYTGSAWAQEQKLTANDAAAGDEFGVFVSIDGNVIAVGAWRNDDAGAGSGSAYVFRYNGSTWAQEQKVTASDAAAGDSFATVSVNGDWLVVGACNDDHAGADSGSAYVFHFDGSVWVEDRKLRAPDATAGDLFGNSVSISGDWIVVGAPSDDDAGSDSGSTYVFPFGPDCNDNGLPDPCDIAAGTSKDCNETGIPDECELISDDCPYQVGDVNNDGAVNREDVLQFILVLLGLDHCSCSVAAADINRDGAVDQRDIRPFRRLLRCKLDRPMRGSGHDDSITALTALADELGVELDLRTLLHNTRDLDPARGRHSSGTP